MKGKSTFKIFFGISLLIMLTHFVLHQWTVLGKDQSIFYLDEQITLGSVFTIVSAFFAGYQHLLKVSEIKEKKKRIQLLSIATVFFAFLLDEYLEIHEYLNTLVKEMLETDSVLGQLASLSWIFPLSLIILFILGMFTWNLLNESNKVAKNAYIIGSLMFVLVLILEVGGAASYGEWYYTVFVGFEEGLEMFAMSMFILAGMNTGVKEGK